MKKRVNILSSFALVAVLFSLSTIFFWSCTPEKVTRNERALQWKLNVGAQTFFWQGFYPDQLINGSAIVTIPNNIPFKLTLSRTNIKRVFEIILPKAEASSFVMSATDKEGKMFDMYDDGVRTHSTEWGGEMNIVITEYSPKAFGPVKGYCYGSVGRNPANGGGTLAINGSFEAIRGF
jgi:hypothetical protein